MMTVRDFEPYYSRIKSIDKRIQAKFILAHHLGLIEKDGFIESRTLCDDGKWIKTYFGLYHNYVSVYRELIKKGVIPSKQS
jgi:hypothetical protein